MKKITGGSEKQIALAEKIREKVLQINNTFDMEDEEEVKELTDEINEKLERYARHGAVKEELKRNAGIVKKNMALLNELKTDEISETWEDFVNNTTAVEWIFYQNNNQIEILERIFRKKIFNARQGGHHG
jgi:hypothetical protein